MSERFDDKDKHLTAAFTLAEVLSVVIGIIIFIAGVYSTVTGALSDSSVTIVAGIIAMIMSILMAFVFWIFFKVWLGMCRDIKYIRNKLYDEDNKSLDGEDEDDENEDDYDILENIEELSERLHELKQLLDDGILSQKEFENQKQKIIDVFDNGIIQCAMLDNDDEDNEDDEDGEVQIDMDELSKSLRALKQLLDDKILSETEFETQKQKVLGLFNNDITQDEDDFPSKSKK